MQTDELERSVNFIVATYRELFMDRYHREPLAAQIGHSILRSLVRQYGVKQLLELLREYFSQTGDKEWFVRNGHSAEVFAKNIGVVNASLGAKQKKERPKPLFVRIESWCPTCKKSFFLSCRATPSEIEKKKDFTVCPDCIT